MERKKKSSDRVIALCNSYRRFTKMKCFSYTKKLIGNGWSIMYSLKHIQCFQA